MALTKTAIDKDQALALINNFYKKIESYVNQSATPSPEDLKKFLTNDFHLDSDGKVLTKTAEDYLQRIKNFQKKYSHIEVTKPFEEPIVNANRIAIQYKLDLTTKNGEHKQILISAIGSFSENKLSRWSQVTHEPDMGTWDK